MMNVTYEGVTFIRTACQKMSKTEFIEAHIGIFWQDREKKTRRKMLSEAYDKIVPPVKDEE